MPYLRNSQQRECMEEDLQRRRDEGSDKSHKSKLLPIRKPTKVLVSLINKNLSNKVLDLNPTKLSLTLLQKSQLKPINSSDASNEEKPKA